MAHVERASARRRFSEAEVPIPPALPQDGDPVPPPIQRDGAFPTFRAAFTVAFIAVAVVAVLTIRLAADAEPQKQKLPVPDAAAQSSARTLIKEIYGDQYEDANADSAKAALAKRLIRDAADTKDPAGKYVLLLVASEIAVEAVHPDLVLQAIARLDDGFQVSAIDLKADALANTVKSAPTTNQKRRVIRHLLLVADQAVQADRYDAAERLVRLTSEVAAKARDRTTSKVAKAKLDDIQALRDLFHESRLARATLAKNPKDGKANVTLGRYICFVKGDWAEGLPYLDAGSEFGLELVARAELAKPATPAAFLKLGDSWWTVSANDDEPFQTAQRQRAAHWYRKALPELSGLSRAKVFKRLASVPSPAPQPVEIARADGKPDEPAPKPEEPKPAPRPEAPKPEEPKPAPAPGGKDGFAVVKMMQDVTPLRVRKGEFVVERFHIWGEIPKPLENLYFLRNKEHQGTTKFTVLKPGKVLMAVTWQFQGRGWRLGSRSCYQGRFGRSRLAQSRRLHCSLPRRTEV